MAAKRTRVHGPSERLVRVEDLCFPMTPGADYEALWDAKMTASELYRVLFTDESAILFCARLGWIDSASPVCSKPQCRSKNTSSYLFRRKNGGWTWRFRCCKSTSSIFSNSMFWNLQDSLISVKSWKLKNSENFVFVFLSAFFDYFRGSSRFNFLP